MADLRKQLIQVTVEFDEQKRLEDIEAALASGLLTAEEKERLEMEKRAILIRQQIRDVEEQRDTEVDAAQDRLNALKEEEALMKARVDAMRSYIEQLIKSNNLIAEQVRLLEKLMEELTEPPDAPEPGEPDTGLAGMFFDLSEVLAEAEAAAQRLREAWDELTQPLGTLFEEGGPIDTLMSSLANLSERIS